MRTASLVRTSVTPIGRKFILQGQINNPTISATALSSITVVTQRVPLELLTSAVEMTHYVTNGLDSVCDGRIAARAYVWKRFGRRGRQICSNRQRLARRERALAMFSSRRAEMRHTGAAVVNQPLRLEPGVRRVCSLGSLRSDRRPARDARFVLHKRAIA